MSSRIFKEGYSLTGDRLGGPHPPPRYIRRNHDGTVTLQGVSCWECYSKLCEGVKGTHACSFCPNVTCSKHISHHLSHDKEDRKNAVHMWYCSICMKKYHKYEIDLVEEVIDLTEAED